MDGWWRTSETYSCNYHRAEGNWIDEQPRKWCWASTCQDCSHRCEIVYETTPRSTHTQLTKYYSCLLETCPLHVSAVKQLSVSIGPTNQKCLALETLPLPSTGQAISENNNHNIRAISGEDSSDDYTVAMRSNLSLKVLQGKTEASRTYTFSRSKRTMDSLLEEPVID